MAYGVLLFCLSEQIKGVKARFVDDVSFRTTLRNPKGAFCDLTIFINSLYSKYQIWRPVFAAETLTLMLTYR
jgi:hypothetical protein